jgi:hypothetical protein
LSFDTCLTEHPIAEPPGIFPGVNRDPDFLAGRGVLQQPVAALPRSDIDEPAAFSLRITSAQVTDRA